MPVTIARVDQRLIHGMVVSQWVREAEAQRIMVVDNDIAKDEDQKQIMRMSKPAGTGMSLIDEKTAINNFKAGRYDNHNVLLVVNNLEVLLRLIKNGVKIPKVNLGIMFDREDREKITSHVAISPGERKIIDEIEELGVPVSVHLTPNDREEPYSTYKK